MKHFFLFAYALITVSAASAQRIVEWISTSEQQPWKKQTPLTRPGKPAQVDIEILTNKPLQVIEGFGTCFNELGWTSLSFLSIKDREGILKEMFAPGIGANFTICRMPIGANDFSRAWYSYDEQEADFTLSHFNITNDLQTLIPFIHNAQKYNPKLKVWASPWSPPSWMKYNKHYAARSVLGKTNFQSEEYGMDLRGINNGLQPDKEGREGTDMFIQEDVYYKAYSLYFAKFIEAYRQQKINIGMVMPQNEFNSAQVFPSCTWTAAGLCKFISYLGPTMESIGVKIFFGTMERANAKLVDTILTDPQSSKYIKGIGFQWAGKGAIADLHRQYPQLPLYQSEQECGNGKNDWKYCVYAWSLMKHYLLNGANAYMYWNTSLKQGGISTWGWKQNSLVSVDTVSKSFTYNHEYYLMKHVSHFVKPGARLLTTSGSFSDLLAFVNPDKSIVVVMSNETSEQKEISFKIGKNVFSQPLAANTFNTLLLK